MLFNSMTHEKSYHNLNIIATIGKSFNTVATPFNMMKVLIIQVLHGCLQFMS